MIDYHIQSQKSTQEKWVFDLFFMPFDDVGKAFRALDCRYVEIQKLRGVQFRVVKRKITLTVINEH